MAKTRTKVSRSIIKKEANEETLSLVKLPHITKNASKNKNKVTKHKTVETWVDITPRFVLFKSESPSGNRSDVSSPSVPTLRKRSTITKEQITKLIHYIVKGRTSIKAAARKTGMSEQTAHRYYKNYKLDPERKVPSERTYIDNPPPKLTQKKIEEVINYIVHDKMSVTQASSKANVSLITAEKYYKKYLQDPERKVPLVYNIENRIQKKYTQEQINNLINYIVNDKIPVPEASRKVNVDPRSGRRYYLKYLEDPDRRIPVPGRNITRSSKTCTNEQVRALIGYIANDGMSLMKASVKAGIGQHAAKKYYKQYSEDPEHKIPTPESSYAKNILPTIDKVKKFFTYVIVDKLEKNQASRKAGLSYGCGIKYYKQYIKNPTKELEIKDTSYSVEKMGKMVEYVQKDKMSLKAAAEKAELVYVTGIKYYRQYVKNPELGIPVGTGRYFTQEEVNKLIDYIVHFKMTIASAARKINMSYSTATKYYEEYRRSSQRTIPAPGSAGLRLKRKLFDQYSQIVADIYKNNPSIRPIHEKHDPKLESPDIYIKQENLE